MIPTLEQVLKRAEIMKMDAADAEEFFAEFEQDGWSFKGEAVRDWRSLLRSRHDLIKDRRAKAEKAAEPQSHIKVLTYEDMLAAKARGEKIG